MDVSITDPAVFVSQVQGPTSMDVLAAASDDGMPEPFNYFGIAHVNFGGQQVVITRTGYTNELGWEFYTEPHHDAEKLWAHLCKAAEPFGLGLFGLDSMHIRRIEAGILNAGSDFDMTTTSYDVGLGRFVDQDKAEFIGKAALLNAAKASRLTGLKCEAEPHIGGVVYADGNPAGKITAGAMSPYLQCGVGIALMKNSDCSPGDKVSIQCTDGKEYAGELVTLPLYDKDAEIPRGKRVDIPRR